MDAPFRRYPRGIVAGGVALVLLGCSGFGGSRPAANTFPGRSIGPIAVGQACAEVISSLGSDNIFSDFGDATYYEWKSRGLSILCSQPTNTVGTIFAYSGRACGYEAPDWTPFDAVLPNGLSFDSNYWEVIEKMGFPSADGDHSSSPIPSRWISYQGIGFDFVTASDEMCFLKVYEE